MRNRLCVWHGGREHDVLPVEYRDLHLGRADYTMYTSDLSPEYIDFNRSEYAYWKNAGLG